MVFVRRFEERDAEALAKLMLEMAAFYKAAVDPNLIVAQSVIHQSKSIDIIVAEKGNDLLGFATFTSLYPVAGLLAFTYVQQIYVGQSARRLGVARGLMAEIARVSKPRGITRIEWSTAKENVSAQELYESLGASGENKIYYVLTETAMDRLAERSSAPSLDG